MKTALALCLLAAPLSAQLPRFDAQGAVDLAAPGSLVRLPGGHYPLLVITKPLTILAEPRARIDRIVLQGPGGGDVTLANLATASDLAGRGFEALHLVDMEILGIVKPAGLRYLELARCTVGTTRAGVHDVDVPGTTLMLLDVRFPYGTARVVADRLFHTAGSSPLQDTLVNVERVLPDDLTITGDLRIAHPFILTWNLPGPRHALLFGSYGTRGPVSVPGWRGFWHLDESAILLTGLPSGGGPRGMRMWIPNDASLLGAKLAMQMLDGPDYLSRPVVGVVRP